MANGNRLAELELTHAGICQNQECPAVGTPIPHAGVTQYAELGILRGLPGTLEIIEYASIEDMDQWVYDNMTGCK